MLEIRAMSAADWPAVEEVYAAGIATGDATFETEPPRWEEFDRGRLPHSRFVAIEDGSIVGWARRERIARLRGVWRDTILLERCSPHIS